MWTHLESRQYASVHVKFEADSKCVKQHFQMTKCGLKVTFMGKCFKLILASESICQTPPRHLMWPLKIKGHLTISLHIISYNSQLFDIKLYNYVKE